MKKLLLIAATTVALSTSALAEVENPFYVKLNGGGSWLQDLDLGEGRVENENTRQTAPIKIKFKSEFAPVGIFGIGYHLMDNLRMDLTGEMIFNPKFKLKVDAIGAREEGTFTGETVGAVMLNGYVDIFDVSVAGFFVGAGAGVSHQKFKATRSETDSDGNVDKDPDATSDSKMGFAYQVTAGISVPLSDVITAEFAYSWRDYGKMFKKDEEFNDKNPYLRGHHALIGIRFSF